MLINLRNALMAGKRLPYDAEVEYLESTGTQWQWIDVLDSARDANSFEMSVAMLTDNSARRIFFGSGGGDKQYLEVTAATKWGAGLSSGAACQIGAATTIAVGTDRLLQINGTNAIQGLNLVGSTAPDFPLCLFKTRGYSGYRCAVRCFYFKAWQNGVLVRDFIPVRKGTVGYLYDRVSGKLFGNAGTGDFVLGPDVVPVEWLQSSGDQYIDTGCTVSDKTTFDCEFDTYHGNNSYFMPIFGVYTSDGYLGFQRNSGSNYRSVSFWRGNSTKRALTSTVDATVFLMGTESATFGDGSASLSAVQFQSSATAWFGRVNGFNAYSGTRYLMGLRIWEDSVLVRSFRPIRVGTDATSWEGAMMDVLTRRIYRNAGTGAFTYGNDLKYPIPA